MASALDTYDRGYGYSANPFTHANPHHGPGLMAMGLGTLSGFLASGAIGTLYGWKRDHWLGRNSPWLIAILGKAATLGLLWAEHHRGSGALTAAAVVTNDIGQAGLNVIGLHLGTVLGLRFAGKQLTIKEEKLPLAPGEVRIAGDLPPAQPGRSLENISVEEMANLR